MIYDLQKASVLKRISAFVFDFIMVMVVSVLFALIVAAITGFEAHMDAYEGYLTRYGEEYNIDMKADPAGLSKEDAARYEEAGRAFTENKDAIKEYGIIVNLTLIIPSLGILFAFILLEVVVPVLLGHGRTAGKKIFGIAVMRNDSVRVSTVEMIIRSILGKYTVETMIPVLILIMLTLGMMDITGTIVIFGIMLLNLCMIIFTKSRTMIHDAFAGTVVVDFASQKIFETKQEAIDYIARVNREKAERRDY